MKILITGGAGFVGSHVAENYAKRGEEVVIFDNLSRAKLLGYKTSNVMYNWNYLKRYNNIGLIKGDIQDAEKINDVVKDVNLIIHTAAQTGVTTSLINPRTDFEVNTIGTFNVLEAARLSKKKPFFIYCSTNKVYGNNINKIPIIEKGRRYEFVDKKYKNGISENFPTDLCEHTPYGVSKFTGDIYVQDYSYIYGLKTGVFRMSCIYGPRQFGVEDQGWVAWFTIATLKGKPITIYGDGKQVRDILYINDLVKAFDMFIEKREKLNHGVYNIGGGYKNTISLLELITMLENITGKRSKIIFDEWRPSDQKVYISDITKAKRELEWRPEIDPKEGVKNLIEWVKENKDIL